MQLESITLLVGGEPKKIANYNVLRRIAPTKADRAAILVENNLVFREGESTFFAMSLSKVIRGDAGPGDGYIVDLENYTCECPGFSRNENCHHIIAVGAAVKLEGLSANR